MNTTTRVKEVITHLQNNRMKVTIDNIITQSLFSPSGTLTDENKELINRQIGYYQMEQEIKAKFRHLSNAELVRRINGLPDFKWDDEGYELNRRIKASNDKFEATMQTTIHNIDSQRRVITYYSFAGLNSFATDKKLQIDETPASYSISIFKNRARTELHIFYKP